MKKIILCLILFLAILFAGMSNVFAYSYEQIDSYMWKYYQKMDNNFHDTQSKIDKLEKIKNKIYNIFEAKWNNLSRNNKQLLMLIKSSLINKIEFYKKQLEDIDLTNLLWEIDEEKNIFIKNINYEEFKISYGWRSTTQLFSTNWEWSEKVQYFELEFKYKCFSRVSNIVKNTYIEDVNQTQKYKLYSKWTSKKLNNCITTYYAKNLKINLWTRYFINMWPYNSAIFKWRKTKLDVFISDITGKFEYDENNPYLTEYIYDDEIEQFKFSGWYFNKISSISNNINKIWKILINTNEKNYKIQSFDLRVNLKKDWNKISDESLLWQVYIVDNFWKKYIMEREKYGDENKYITPWPVYSINIALQEHTFENINYDISSFDIYADLSKLKIYKDNEIKIETLLNYTSIDKDWFIYNKQKRDTIFSTLTIWKKEWKKCNYNWNYSNDWEKVWYQKSFNYINWKKYYFINYKCENWNLYELNREYQYLTCNSWYIKKNWKCENIIIEEPKIDSLKMELGKYYLIDVNWVKTIISLKGFSSSVYLDWWIAPTMNIFAEYWENKYFNILGTFVLPKDKWTNNEIDWFRKNISRIWFDYKLNSWDSKKYMTLKLRAKWKFNIKILEINKDNYQLYLRDDLKSSEIINIYKLLDNKMDLLK